LLEKGERRTQGLVDASVHEKQRLAFVDALADFLDTGKAKGEIDCVGDVPGPV
jgi:hypothetical protein